jgi:hypothetical protein
MTSRKLFSVAQNLALTVSMLQEVHQEQISESEKTVVSTLPADCVTLNFFVNEPGCGQSMVNHILDGVDWWVHSHHQ